MTKQFKTFSAVLLAIAAASVLAFSIFAGSKCYTKTKYQSEAKERRLTYAQLDHDITVGTDSTKVICNDQLSGWKASCGPSPAGWPMAFPFLWEVFCVESPNYYFARLIYHEYVLWLSFDYPYVLVKIPKANTSADWATNESARYNTLWNITREFELGYNDPKCITSPQVYTINGHKVSFGGDTFGYSEYEVVHDINHPW